MQLRAAIPAAEILRLCRFLLPAGAKGGNSPVTPGSSSSVSAIQPSLASLDPSLSIQAIDAPDCSGPGSLTFLGSKSPLRLRENLKAALILAEPGVKGPAGIPMIYVASIHAAMAVLISAWQENIARERPFESGEGNRIASGAIVEGSLEGSVTVGAGAYVAKGAYIGAGTRIEPNATILEHAVLGKNCVVQSGAVIGCAGFGFFMEVTTASASASSGKEASDGKGASARKEAPAPTALAAMPHLAGVVIGDSCWIGANSVVAAGVLNPTVIGQGCKLDSHVQIAHNVRLGENGLLASQSGIAGSTVVGDRFRMGGAASMDGHLTIGNDVSVAACSGVTKDLPDGSVVAGFPARPIRDWRRQQIFSMRRKENPEGGAA